MILPAGVFFLLAFVGPILLVGQLAFFKADYVTSVFVGFGNFIDACQDKYFLKSFVNVFWFVLPIAPIGITMAYCIASFLMNFGPKVQAAGRFLCYVPTFTSGLVLTLLWAWLLLRTGLINQFLGELGIPAVPWLATPWTARLSIVMICLSTGPGSFVLLFSAAIKGIPSELHDAAIIDGASERQYKRYVMRPILMPTILLMLLLSIVGTLQMWETIYVLTGQGGPKGSTSTPVYDIFLTAFIFGRPGYAAAKGLILMIVVGAIIFMKQRIERWAGQTE